MLTNKTQMFKDRFKISTKKIQEERRGGGNANLKIPRVSHPSLTLIDPWRYKILGGLRFVLWTKNSPRFHGLVTCAMLILGWAHLTCGKKTQNKTNLRILMGCILLDLEISYHPWRWLHLSPLPPTICFYQQFACGKDVDTKFLIKMWKQEMFNSNKIWKDPMVKFWSSFKQR
jgi:hypothetical protein